MSIKFSGKGRILINGKEVASFDECSFEHSAYTGPIYELPERELEPWPLYRCDSCQEEWMLSTSEDCICCGSTDITKVQ